MENKTKRFLSLVLAMVMVFCLFPMTALATESTDAVQNNLVAWYDFNGVNGTTVKDETGNGNDAALINGASVIEDDRQAGNVLNLTNNSYGSGCQGLELPAGMFKEIQDVTIIMDVNLRSDRGTWQCLMNAGPDNQPDEDHYKYMTFVNWGSNNTNGTFGISNATSKDGNDSDEARIFAKHEDKLSVGTWGRVALRHVAETNEAVIYLNNVKVAEGKLNVTLQELVQFEGCRVLVGCNNVWPDPGLDGLVDNIRVYNKALTEEEMASIPFFCIDTEEELAAAVAQGGTVELGGNITLTKKLTITNDVTIKGSYTLTRDDAYTGTLFTVNAGASLTLDGGLTIDGGNNYKFDSELYAVDLANWESPVATADSAKWFTPEEGAPVATAYMITTTGGTVNLNDVTVQNNYSVNSGIISAGANSTITLTGANIRHNANITNSGLVANVSGAGINVVVNNGTVIDGNHVGGNHGIFKVYSGATLTMNGGEIKNTTGWNSNGTAVGIYSATFIMNGGTICSNSSVYGPDNGRNAAIYGHSGHRFTMNGGTICHNTGRSKAGIDSPYSESGYSGLTVITGGQSLYNDVVGPWTAPDVSGGNTMTITGGLYSQDVSAWVSAPYEVVTLEGEGENGVDLYLVAKVVTLTFDSHEIDKDDTLPEFTYTSNFDEVVEDGNVLKVETPVVEVNGSGEYEITAKAEVYTEGGEYNDDYYVKVVPGKLTVKGLLTVDGVWFDSFDEAKSAIKKNSAIVLYGDVENNYGVGADKDYKFPTNGGNITLELNGHTFHSVKPTVKGGTTTVTIGANTTLTVTDSVGTGSFIFDTKGHPFCLSNNSTLILPETINFEGTIQLYYVNGQVYLGEKLILGEGAAIQTNEWTDSKGTLRKYNNVYFAANGDITLGGGSFTLNEDFTWAADRNITIPAGVTVDLNGNDLTAKNIKVNGNLIDTADGVGVVTAEKLWYNGHNNGGYLPIADGEGYRLFAVELRNLGVKPTGGNKVKFGLTVVFNEADAYLLLADSVVDGSIVANATFTESGDVSEGAFSAGKIASLLKAIYNQVVAGDPITYALTGAMTMNDNSVDVFAELFSGDTNVVITSEVVTYTK